ncbi:MAG: PSD1 and planctomycete cytochrome C domain-containing protein [Planctomycetota bacterium]|nr:PSD1 and planctomycete cytochrome C domain-containing protein [Planctomycetota bacterium]
MSTAKKISLIGEPQSMNLPRKNRFSFGERDVAKGYCSTGIALVLTLVSVSQAWGDSSDQATKFFENQVRPLLAQHCFECHSGDRSEGGLRLDGKQSMIQGGDSGPALSPGKPEESLMITAVRYEGLEMPPDGMLNAEQISVLEAWVKQGAKWPEHYGNLVNEEQSLADRIQRWWAAQPLDPSLPAAARAASNSNQVIDHYVDGKLADVGLQRSPATDRARLIRRLSYDLLGLPPSLEMIERFEKDNRPGAYRRLVSDLFASPAYGERMARLWLDLVRYADSDGWRADAFRPQAWHYRQFVVDAFNHAMPYDQFIKWQIAGDEYHPNDEAALAAVGFLRLGIYEYNQRDAEGQWQNIIDELTDVTADVFLATGLACAKCHDHKFDPIPRSDYFRLRSVFEPVYFNDWKRENDLSETEQSRVDQLLTELKEVEGDDIDDLGMKVIGKFTNELQAMYRKNPKERTSYENQMAYLLRRQFFEEGISGTRSKGKLGEERFNRRQEILSELSELRSNPYGPSDLMSVRDADGAIRATRLPGRKSGREYMPGAPELFGGETLECQPPRESQGTSGRRMALAEWLVADDNPITARVFVNRLWQYHFGTGLVDSPNDFGELGAPPSHPHLLDYLAKRLIESNWDIQAVQREIVLSETYQQSSVNSLADQAADIDPENRLLWHHTVRRVDSEQYRDTLLVAMGSLNYEFGGPSITGTGPRRTLYLRRMRNSVDGMLTALDTPPGLVGTAKRDVTTTAPQSLMMMNSSRVIGVANQFADRVRSDLEVKSIPEKSEQYAAAFVELAHRIIAGVPATSQTSELLKPLVASGKQGQVDVCHILINSNAFLFID